MKFSTGDYLLYYLAKAVSSLFRAMPLGLSLFIARRLGRLFSIISRKRYKIAYANLKAALGKEYNPKELKRILNRTYENIGQGIVDLFLLPKIDNSYIERYIKFENFDIAKDALREGKSIIFLTAHFGTWEISHAALPFQGLSYKGIAREQKPYHLNELLNHYRQLHGCKIIIKGPAVKDALRTLRSNGIVGMLVDQDAGKKGVFTNLFNRPASWNRGVIEIALKTGAVVIPGFAIREKGPFIRFKVFKPLKLREDIGKEDAVADAFRQYASILEDTIRQYPDQWLWQHRRWKSTPARNVIILNDKRTGHLRQSEAVLKQIRSLWQERGHKPSDIRARVVDAEFRSTLCRQALLAGSNLSNACCQGCMRCLRICLKKDSYEALMKSYADIVISCGSSTAAVNLLLAKENNAKSVVIMKPRLIALNKFDLVLIPEHDNPPKGKNIIRTSGALNLIDKTRVNLAANKLIEDIGPLKGRGIGLLLGGDTDKFSMDLNIIEKLTEDIVRAAEAFDAEIFITTSRRTPKQVDEFLKKRLAHETRCRLLVMANEDNRKDAVEAVLGASQVVLVSEESISMISEAASSESYTIVFTQEGLKKDKHGRFLNNLKDKGFVCISKGCNAYGDIENVLRGGKKQPILNNSIKVREALDRIL